MYSAHLLWAVAQIMILPNWIAGPCFLLLSLPLYLYRMPREEAMLQDMFGEEYTRYIAVTGRLIPKIMK